MFWLGKAASGCASYSGPTLNLKEFEGLLAQMKMVSEHGYEVRGGGWERRETDRKPDKDTREVPGMDLFVSFLSWGAGHIFVSVTPQLLLFQGWGVGQDMR